MDRLQRLTKAGRLQQFAIDSFQDHPGLTEQLLAIQGLDTVSWHLPSIREAMASPAVFRAVTMIANLVGSFTLEAWRNGLRMLTPPMLVSRPGVFVTTHDFFRDTAYHLASAGEFIWWVIDRDENLTARKLLLLPPGEVIAERNQRFPLMTDWRWRNKPLPSADVVHGTFVKDPAGLRGFGPLQLCGAALSVAVEADEWAARFFSRGGAPSVNLHSQNSLTEQTANRLVDQWLMREGNEVRVTSGAVEAKPFSVDPESAQLLDSRKHSSADVATMFGMDADLLNAAVSGSSLTYQNVGQRLDNLIRMTIAPNYLEPIEHAITELLPRTTVARFSTQSLTRADIKTQAEVYSTLKAAGMPEEEARSIAGLDSLVDTLPIPSDTIIPRVELPTV